MNSVLLKSGAGGRILMVVLGRPNGEFDRADRASTYDLLELGVGTYRESRDRYDVVFSEGAGSPAGVNLCE